MDAEDSSKKRDLGDKSEADDIQSQTKKSKADDLVNSNDPKLSSEAQHQQNVQPLIAANPSTAPNSANSIALKTPGTLTNNNEQSMSDVNQFTILANVFQQFGDRLIERMDANNNSLASKIDSALQVMTSHPQSITTTSMQTNSVNQLVSIQANVNVNESKRADQKDGQEEDHQQKQFYCKVRLTQTDTVNAIKTRIREAKLLQNSFLKIVNTYTSRDQKDFVLVSKTEESNSKLKEELLKFGYQLTEDDADQTTERWCLYGFPTTMDAATLKETILEQEDRKQTMRPDTIEIEKVAKTRRDSCAIIKYRTIDTINAIRAYPRHFVDLKEHKLTKFAPIMICKNCGGFGHSPELCEQPTKCIKCAEPHHIDRCMNIQGESRCINCIRVHGAGPKAAHGALSMVCFTRREEMERINKLAN